MFSAQFVNVCVRRKSDRLLRKARALGRATLVTFDEPSPSPEGAPRTPQGAAELLRQPRIRLGALVLVAAIVGIVVWVVVSRGSSSTSTEPKVEAIAPVALSASGLATLAHSVRQPIYWAGPRGRYLYELHRTTDGSIFVRYLPPGVNAGATGAGYLTVATYPYKDALQALENVSGAQHVSIPGGGTALVASNYKKSIHLAFPNVNYQVEVYDPSPKRVLALVRSGRIRPV